MFKSSLVTSYSADYIKHHIQNIVLLNRSIFTFNQKIGKSMGPHIKRPFLGSLSLSLPPPLTHSLSLPLSFSPSLPPSLLLSPSLPPPLRIQQSQCLNSILLRIQSHNFIFDYISLIMKIRIMFHISSRPVHNQNNV